MMMLIATLKLKKYKGSYKCFFFLLLMLAGFSFSMTENVSAAETVTEVQTYVTTNKDEQSGFETEKEIEGKKYTLKDVKHEVISQEPVTEAETITKISDAIKEGEEYIPEDTISEYGITYNLKYTDEQETVIEHEFTQDVKAWSDYQGKDKAEAAPDEKEVTVVNKKTKKEVTVKCKKTGTTMLDTAIWEDTYIDITFIAYDADSFIWNDIEIPKNVDEPLKGYEKELIESVGGTTDNYTVESIKWQGKMYLNDEGVPCRNARAFVKKKVPYWRVTYTGNIQEEEVKGTIYTSTYEGMKSIDDLNNYTIKATATYEAESNMTQVVIASLVILLVIVLIIGTLFILRKNQRN